MSVFKLKILIYWCYGVVATLIFSAKIVGLAAYQYDIDSTAIQNIDLNRELATLASGLLFAMIVPALGLRKLLPSCFLFTAVVSLSVFIYPSAITFQTLYISLGFIFGVLQIGFLNELANVNKVESGLLSDTCHLEAVYTTGIMVIVVGSGLLMQFQQFELHYLYLVIGLFCVGVGLLAIFKKQYYFVDESSLTLREILRLGIRTLPEILKALSKTMVFLAISCIALTVFVTTFVLNWINLFNTSELQMSDSLLWQFSILLISSTISGRLVVGALVHYVPLLNILRIITAISILCIMGFVISFYQQKFAVIPDSMAEIPAPMLLIILMAFTNGGIVPLLIGTAAYHTLADKRGIILGVITSFMSCATLLSNLFFRWVSKLFTAGVLLALMTIPLAFILVLSTLFITDLRKSTSSVSE